MARKRKPPSRVRYEQSHPTVSCRVSREVYDRLEKARKTGGKSFAYFLKIGLGVVEVQTRKEQEVREQAYREAYERGYDEAERLYGVKYRCTVCGGHPIVVSSAKEKEVITRYMEEQGWGHGECHEKKRREAS